jgi:hypothetical protein
VTYQVAKLFQYRVVHSLLILAFLLHLRLCSLAVRGLQCVAQSDGSVVLAVDPTVECWKGEHLLLASACGVWAVFVIRYQHSSDTVYDIFTSTTLTLCIMRILTPY